MTDPLPVIPLDYAEPADDRDARWRRVNRVALVAGAAAALVAWGLVLFEVETVLGSGPSLAVVGVAMLVGGLRRRQPWIWGIGLAHVGVCALFVALVNLLGWGPQDAARPFALMGGAYNLLTLPLAVVAWMRRAG